MTDRSETLFPTGHTSKVNCVKNLHDGTLASGSDDKSIIIWNMTRPITKLAQINAAHSDRVISMEMLPNGYLVSGSKGVIKIWNTKTQANINTITLTSYNTADIRCLAVVNSTHMVAGTQKDGTNGFILIFDMTSYTLKTFFSYHTDDVNVFKVLASGLLVSGSSDSSVRVWNLTSLTNVQTFASSTGAVYCLEQIIDESLVVGGNAADFYYWYVDGSAMNWLNQDSNYLTGVGVHCQDIIYNPTTRILATVTNQNKIRLLNIGKASNLTGDLPDLQHTGPGNLQCIEDLSNFHFTICLHYIT